MEIKKARQVKEKNEQIIGLKDEKGFTATSIIIVPSNPHHNEQFLKLFIESKDAELSLIPYLNEDLEVWAIDEIYLKRDNILIHKSLY